MSGEIAFLEGLTIVYKSSIDLFFYVVGSSQENEVTPWGPLLPEDNRTGGAAKCWSFFSFPTRPALWERAAPFPLARPCTGTVFHGFEAGFISSSWRCSGSCSWFRGRSLMLLAYVWLCLHGFLFGGQDCRPSDTPRLGLPAECT